MNSLRSILSHYFTIIEENESAAFLTCKSIPVSFSSSETTTQLWKKHDDALQKNKVQNTEPHQSLLDLKIELASRIFQSCSFCEHKCHIDRRTSAGFCHVQDAHIASEFLHYGEESVLIPSYTIFFSGCTFHCVYCQNWDISQEQCGITIPPDELAQMISQRKKQGARNVNWVGGDPTSNILYILKALKASDENIPHVWNSNMYCSQETMRLLNGVIDVYLTDFKYGNDTCAQRLSKVERYTKVIKRNHAIAYLQGEMIVRHLILPNHITCCSQPILDWIKKNIPEVAVNIMAQYRPMHHAREYEEISRPLSQEEYQQVKQYADTLQMNLF